jgi:hypothetical protein
MSSEHIPPEPDRANVLPHALDILPIEGFRPAIEQAVGRRVPEQILRERREAKELSQLDFGFYDVAQVFDEQRRVERKDLLGPDG